MLSNDEPSLTALTAAAARAAHLIVDGDPLIFKDDLAAALLGERADDLIGYHRAHGAHPVLSGARAQVTTRSRYTEDDSLPGNLITGGFDMARPALVSWLGVTMYLTPAAIGRTLTEIARFAPGSELIADYMLPAHLRDAAGNTYADLVMPVTAERGEPWLTFLTPEEMSALLRKHGLEPRQVSQREAVGGALWERTDSLRPISLSFLAHAILRAPHSA